MDVREICLDNGDMVCDKNILVNKFNKYSSTIGANLSNALPQTLITFRNYLGSRVQQSIFLCPATNSEMIMCISKLKSGKAVWYDNIPSYFLKLIADIISTKLSYFFNASLELGVFPASLKIARVVPIYKSGETNIMSNYRPISVLPCIAMLFEHLLHKRLTSFIDNHKIIDKSQFGFQHRHTTSHAIIVMISYIIDRVEETKNTSVQLLLSWKKLSTLSTMPYWNKYGIRGLAHQLLKNYLAERKQFVKIGCHQSHHALITSGVPQESVLGPVSFFIFVNDIGLSSNLISKFFADDTSLLDSDKSISILEKRVNAELVKVFNWMNANKIMLISLNVAPSKIFRQQQISIYINQISLENVNSLRHLGIHIDHLLKWNTPIDNLLGKFSRTVSICSMVLQFGTAHWNRLLIAWKYSKTEPYDR